MPKKVLDAEIVHGFRRRSNSCFTTGVDTVNIRSSFSYALNIGMVFNTHRFSQPNTCNYFLFLQEGSSRTPCDLKQCHPSILRCNHNTWKYFQFSELSNNDHLVVLALGVLLSFFYSKEFLVNSEFAYNQQLMLIAKVPSVLTLDSYQHFCVFLIKKLAGTADILLQMHSI